MTVIVGARSNINISGEQVCLRARTQWVPSAGLLWTAVSLMSISSLLNGAVHFVLFGRVAGALLSANSYVSDVLPGSHVGFYLGAWFSTALIGTLTLWVAARPRPAVGDYAWEPPIALCGRLAIGSLVVSFVALHLISSTDKGPMDRPVPSPDLPMRRSDLGPSPVPPSSDHLHAPQTRAHRQSAPRQKTTRPQNQRLGMISLGRDLVALGTPDHRDQASERRAVQA